MWDGILWPSPRDRDISSCHLCRLHVSMRGQMYNYRPGARVTTLCTYALTHSIHTTVSTHTHAQHHTHTPPHPRPNTQTPPLFLSLSLTHPHTLPTPSLSLSLPLSLSPS